MNLYWGDLHNHCGISYGYGSLDNALKNARGHLDFCCVTGHAMWPDMYGRNEETAFIVDFHERGFEKLRRGWEETRRKINEANDDQLVTFQSYEMHSSRFGDHHFVSPDAQMPLIYRDSPAEIIRDCGCRAIAIPHHIGYTPGYRGIDWELYDESISPLVEVVSKHGCAMREDGPLAYYHDMGPLDPRNTVAEGLKRGKRFSFVGSTDHHAGFPGSYSDGIAAVWAEEKTREGIWAALLAGHTYACTGARIACRFHLNDAMMGDRLHAGRRALCLNAQGDTPLESLTIRRNGQVFAALTPQGALPERDPENRYLLRVELGWSSDPERYHWEGELRVDDGKVIRVQPYYRGKNALSPADRLEGAEEECNRCDNGYALADGRVAFRCDTFGNISTLHPMTSAFLIELQASLDARITLTVNGIRRECTLRQLTECGFSAHVKPWHSHAFKVHTAYAAAACRGVLEVEDSPHSDCDVYQAEVVQTDGQRAFCSPIFVMA